MKIFNWVHRKLHHNVDYYTVSRNQKDSFPQNEKHGRTVSKDNDREALLNHVTRVDVLDGWRDGILTIGTFGFDPLKLPLEYSVKEFVEQEYSVAQEEEGDDGDEGELNPLVVKAVKHNLETDTDTVVVPKSRLITTVEDIPLIGYLESPELKPHHCDIDSENDGKKKKGERTTLADLFSADTDVTDKSGASASPTVTIKKEAFRKKHGLSFVKRLIPRIGEEYSRPMATLQQEKSSRASSVTPGFNFMLITRLMKRKIHPDLDFKIHRNDGAIVASKTKKDKTRKAGRSSSTDGEVHEAVALLQDAVAGVVTCEQYS